GRARTNCVSKTFVAGGSEPQHPALPDVRTIGTGDSQILQPEVGPVVLRRHRLGQPGKPKGRIHDDRRREKIGASKRGKLYESSPLAGDPAQALSPRFAEIKLVAGHSVHHAILSPNSVLLRSI